ncbi:putative GTPase [Tepidibacillus fermentans]|uniref:Putative GTPase n=1 Tax=Tepidibacillus fermentans TaxID=1281767 RepID=A0A4R3KIM8_9BACI|nr:putative GTPase [Tepidibacillus fermentans]
MGISQIEKNKAILVGIYLLGHSHERTNYSLEELKRLAKTANLEVKMTFTQIRTASDPSWYIGKGKSKN